MASRIAIVGAGWAGIAAAVELTARGHAVTLYEAARVAGGRARRIGGTDDKDGHHAKDALDNGQHILIGAYTETLALMRRVGVDPDRVLHRQPLALQHPDGSGLRLPDLPAPWDVAIGVLRARGWSLRDRWGLLRAAAGWRASGFACDPAWTVQRLCDGLPPCVMAELVEPLCVSALNTPADQASAQVFLTVMRDALLGPRGSSHLLIPRCDLSALLPEPATAWLQAYGAQVRLGQRVSTLTRVTTPQGIAAHSTAADAPRTAAWQVEQDLFDAVVLACPAWEAARLVSQAALAGDDTAHAAHEAQLRAWAKAAASLRHEAITTVYLRGVPALPEPMWSLRSGPGAPAQFVFDRAQLIDDGGSDNVKAFVISASDGDRDSLTAQVMQQAQALGWHNLQPVQTVVEKRATFACTPGLQRPARAVAPGLCLWACGDYTEGPYPATLEGAVRSGLAVADAVEGAVAGAVEGAVAPRLRPTPDRTSPTRLPP
ncbi:MAG: hydroxysqualene dehydroxylase HpnE [Burkholderiaceae bacterium]